MFGLTTYQEHMFIAYSMGIVSQMIILYILSKTICKKMELSTNFIPIYIAFGIFQFLAFIKLIKQT